ncbi:hypothetical protein [Rhizobium binae]|uniref:hypothetical protein n=1 Tax=Rhizobium binae TaxID=1138190 RepID=UPI001FF01450|nr:hypothetical protein [Rhizobium binae]
MIGLIAASAIARTSASPAAKLFAEVYAESKAADKIFMPRFFKVILQIAREPHELKMQPNRRLAALFFNGK